MYAAMLVLIAGCTAEAVAPPPAPVQKTVAPPSAALPPASSQATGRDESDSLPIDCVRAIASRQEDDRTIVYITLAEQGSVRPGQWVHCAHEDRPPSPPCEVLDIVDGGMLEARCGQAAT
jgi:hypothetical protein